MPLRLHRRAFIGTAGIVTAGIALPMISLLPGAALAADPRAFADIEHAVGGRLGVCALDTATGARIGHRVDERFAMCSTFKWLLAATVLEAVDRGAMTLADKIPYTRRDLIAYSPVTEKHVDEGAMTVEALCEAIMLVSDNAAANVLLSTIGGPARVTAFVRAHGDAVTRLDRTEPDLNSNLPGDPRDTTTPAASVATLKTLLLGDTLSAASRVKLLDWMKACQTGKNRLRAGLPGEWAAGDKTGSGATSTNDVAIAWPPGKPPILIAAYLSGAKVPLDKREQAHADVARAVAAAFTR